jgi:CRISPR-associated protein, Cas_csx13 family
MALKYRLSNPNYTIYHRAALAGLAATIAAWEDNQPEGIKADFESDFVEITWDETLTEQEALKRILAASFKLTGEPEQQMIDLPGHFIESDRDDLRLVIHNSLCLTFLQHHKMRPGPKQAVPFELRNVDQETGKFVSYKPLYSYAHQTAQGTGLLDEKLAGQFPKVAIIPQSMIPGAMAGKKALQAPADEAILLLFLIVGCTVFLLRPRTFQEKAQACIIVPDVIDLKRFVWDIKRIVGQNQEAKFFSNTYLKRVVGGAEEAALRFLVDINTNVTIETKKSIVGCQVIAMGKVAWDNNQINRSLTVKLNNDYPELDVFKVAYQELNLQAKLIATKKGESFAIPASPIPELIAANLASNRHWCAHFKDLVSEQKEFKRILSSKGGLNKMAKAVKDEIDSLIIQAFYEAWKRIRGQLSERAKNKNLDYFRLLEVRSERIRNEILRLKTSDMLANWFLRFCAEATKGKNLVAISNHPEKVRQFLFDSHNFDRFQNLLLFALVSYKTEPFEPAQKLGENSNAN